jgi:hypothetical protein
VVAAALLDIDPINLNRIAISSLVLSMIVQVRGRPFRFHILVAIPQAIGRLTGVRPAMLA